MNAKQADMARTCISHYISTLGVTIADFAKGCDISADKLSAFMQGTRDAVDQDDVDRLGRELTELVEAEDHDIADAKYFGRTQQGVRDKLQLSNK